MDESYQNALAPYGAAEQERIVRAGFLDKMRRVGRKLPFARDAVAAYFAMIDPKVPAFTRAAMVAPLAYFVVPTDMIPDFLLGLGFTDDALVFWAAFRAFRKHITERHYEKADGVLA